MPNTRLKYGEYYADILTSWRDGRAFFVYVVQRHGSADVLAMGSCESEQEAIAFAEEAISHLRAKATSA
jgi:hypothetical protein